MVGEDNIFVFGEDSQTVIDRYARGDYSYRSYYEKDEDLKRAVDFIVSDDLMKIGCKENLERLYNELLSKAGFFSSDRTIDQYNKEIWKL